ncbi:MAG: hypothetical protein LC101_11500 [Flavobacteriales bacterium]|nr:hypothetical protein [Flavobacteriales bacterium]
MGNYRSGNKYRVAIGLETSLGSGNTYSDGGTPPTLSIRWQDLTVMPVKLELNPDRQLIDTNYKTGTSQATAYEQVQGVTDGTFTLSGKLSLDYEILLKAMFHQSPVDHKYTFDDTPPKAKSLVMMKVWDDAPTSSKYKVDIAKGCAVDSLVITGRSKEAIEFTLTGRLTDHQREIEQVITGTDPGLTFPDVVQFGDTGYSGNFGETNRLTEFTLTLTNIYIDDTKRYTNSMSRLRDIILRQEGELNVKGLFKQETTELNPMDDIGVDKQLSESITLVSGTNSWVIGFQALVTAFDSADPDRDLFESNVTMKAIASVDVANSVSIQTS